MIAVGRPNTGPPAAILGRKRRRPTA